MKPAGTRIPRLLIALLILAALLSGQKTNGSHGLDGRGIHEPCSGEAAGVPRPGKATVSFSNDRAPASRSSPQTSPSTPQGHTPPRGRST